MEDTIAAAVGAVQLRRLAPGPHLYCRDWRDVVVVVVAWEE